ncbi:MAG: hypothetical protein Q9162_006619 [Coniocarpon cinnabarinum]
MYISANPERQKTQAEKDDVARTYTIGDTVLVQDTDVSERQERSRDGASSAEEDDRQLLQHAQELSLHDVSDQQSQVLARHDHGHHNPAERPQSGPEEPRSSNDRDRSRSRALQLGHQSSLRSLLNPHDSAEMKEEILRQIVEEGILDDIDWDNMQVEQEDEISERIAQAYKRRRRQRPRPRDDSRRREEGSRDTSRSHSAQRQPRHGRSSSASQAGRQDPVDSVSTQASNNMSLPPVSRPHLFEAGARDIQRHRRSTSQGRLGLPRTGNNPVTNQAATRSATDLSDRPTSSDSRNERPRRSYESRRTTDPDRLPASEQWKNIGAMPNSAARIRPERRRASQPSSAPPSRSSFEPQADLHPAIMPDISVSCDRCGKDNIQYQLHYTCVGAASIGLGLAMRHGSAGSDEHSKVRSRRTFSIVKKGDFDMCINCFDKMNPPSNSSHNSSRKCPEGHRLLLVDFAITNGATDIAWRRVLEGHSGAWVPEGLIPPATGNPYRAEALWPWIPEDDVKDEIRFPKGAIVEDVVPMNDEFSWGVYCRLGGYFPSAYVRPV